MPIGEAVFSGTTAETAAMRQFRENGNSHPIIIKRQIRTLYSVEHARI